MTVLRYGARGCPGRGGGMTGGAAVVPFTSSFTSNFPSTENPMRQSGAWVEGGADGLLWTDMQTTGGSPGVAWRTMTAFNGTNYIDSLAHLKNFAPNHSMQGTLSSAPVSGLESEHLLRFRITANIARGYEVDLVGSSSNLYLVRWNGSGTNTTSNFDVMVGPIAVTLNSGSVMVSSIVGPNVVVKIDGTTVLTQDVQAWAVANGGAYWTDGNPGIGSWNETGSSNNGFAWSSITALSL